MRRRCLRENANQEILCLGRRYVFEALMQHVGVVFGTNGFAPVPPAPAFGATLGGNWGLGNAPDVVSPDLWQIKPGRELELVFHSVRRKPCKKALASGAVKTNAFRRDAQPLIGQVIHGRRDGVSRFMNIA
jgi:hypothetical protein